MGDSEFAYVLRNCEEGGISHEGFVWPQSGLVEVTDWDPTPECGHGLHGWLDAAGDFSLGNGDGAPVWIVVKVRRDEVVDLGGKVKFPRGEIVYYGDVDGAVVFLASVGICGYRGQATAGNGGQATAGYRGQATAGDNGQATAGYRGQATAGDNGQATAGNYGQATAGNGGQATAGYRGQATAGDNGQATAGNYGQATAGYRGQATAGYRGQATAGDNGQATAGEKGEISIRWWDQKSERYRVAVGYVGEDGIEANVAYKVEDGVLVKAEK